MKFVSASQPLDPHPELEILGRQIARWVKDNFDTLRQARPNADGIDNRLYDNWMPLLAVADVAGGEWSRWARITAQWFASKAAEQPSIKVELLTDIVTAMGDRDRMFSESFVKTLGAMADRPWSDWKRGKPLNQMQMARMLKAFGIKSGTIRINDDTAKGYYTADIVTARNRYAPATEAAQPSQKINDNEIDELEAIFVTFRNDTENDTDPSQAADNRDEGGFNWASGTQQSNDPYHANGADRDQRPGRNC